MVAAFPLPLPPSPAAPRQREGEQRVLLYGVPWDAYVAFRDAVDSPGVRMTYCEGDLEIMSPLPDHEDVKTTIARLVEMYASERDVPLYGYGSTTFRKAAKKRGLEPDECYCVGHKLEDFPDIAIEVVLTSGGMEKLPVYAGLGVREVWFWADDAFHLHALHAGEYQPVQESEVLPELDLAVVARFVRMGDQHEAVRALRAWLRETR
jgi:Uma2 family endonuclease